MRKRILGKNGPEVPVICFGTWPIGGGMGKVNQQQAIKTIQTAIESGITFFDTAEGYKTSEAVLGQALQSRRHQVILASKLSGSDHSPKHIQNALNNSLISLKTDYIDIYQLHTPQPKWPIQETMAELIKLKEQGKILHLGLSNYSVEETMAALLHGPIQSSQPRYNIIFNAEEKDHLKFCYENQIGVLTHSVLAKGLLTGKYKPGHVFDYDDERRLFNFFRGQLFEKINEIVQNLNYWANERDKNITQLAIAWVLAQPAVTSAIVGMKTLEQVEQARLSSGWKLSEAEMAEVSDIIGKFKPKWKKDPLP
jgi:aryl-alcohol dehydrogenase-like predicted oxidoreductase